MSRRVKAFSEGPYPVAIPIPHEQKNPLDITHQYSELKRFLQAQKQKEELQHQRNLPFKFMYYGLAGIFITVLIIGAHETTSSSSEMEIKVQKQSEECLMRFHSNNCQLANPSEECSRLLKCMKNRPSQMGNLEYFYYSIRNAFALVSDKILGPIMLGIFGIMIKFIQVLIRNQVDRSLS